MRVVVFLAFLLQSRVCGADRRGRVRGKRQELLEERLDMFFGLGGRLIPVGAGFNFGQDFTIIQSVMYSYQSGSQPAYSLICR